MPGDIDPEVAAAAQDAAAKAKSLWQQYREAPERFKYPKRGFKAQYEWLQRFGTFDRDLHVLKADRIIPFSDIEIWRHKVRGTTEFSRKKAERRAEATNERPGRNYRNALHSPITAWPNPTVTDKLVIASFFSPGRIRAVDRESGRKRWSINLDYYSTESLLLNDNVLYGGTCMKLLAMDLETGRIRWEFEPYPGRPEVMYSLPTITAGRLFIGDRNGCFHCIDATSGRWLWWQRPSRARNRDVNTTARVFGDRVIVSTNSRLVLAYDVISGRELWRTHIDRSSVCEVLALGQNALIRSSRSAYLLDTQSGSILHRWHWRHFEIVRVAVAEDLALIVRRRFLPGGYMWQTEELLAYRGAKLLYCLAYPMWSGPDLCVDTSSGLVYECTARGLGILEPATGRRLAVIENFGIEPGRYGMPVNKVAPPTVVDGKLYILTKDADICCGTFPELERSAVA